MKNLNLLLELIPNHPGLNLAVIDDGTYTYFDDFFAFCQTIEASLYIKSLNGLLAQNTKALHVEDFSFEQARYNKHALQYDFLFIFADLEHRDDINLIANKTYRVIKNAAHLFLLVPKHVSSDFYTILEESNFVALNTIELNNDIDIISAKKMHGWTRI